MLLQILNNGELMNHNNRLQEGIMFVVNLIRSPSLTKKKQKTKQQLEMKVATTRSCLITRKMWYVGSIFHQQSGHLKKNDCIFTNLPLFFLACVSTTHTSAFHTPFWGSEALMWCAIFTLTCFLACAVTSWPNVPLKMVSCLFISD